ncbi:MAG TPA: hypothetical protein VLC98_00535 [Phnomibacter sp.]|nr:hypothetical protein [Phnomibacter sp.]
MRYLRILGSVVLFFTHMEIWAQPSEARDSSLPAWNRSRAQLINAPVLTGTSTPVVNILPNAEQFCFDLLIGIELFYGGRNAMQTCLFINTREGYYGYTPLKQGSPISELRPADENFRFFVVNNKLSRVCNYFNRKGRGGAIEHYVSTANTDQHEMQMRNLMTAAPLVRKTEWRTYCEGRARSLSYKHDGSPVQWFLFGDRYPASVTIGNYLGGFGVGAIKTEAGTFVVMERTENANNYSAIKFIDKKNICFNPAGYTVQEEAFHESLTASMVRERQSIEKAERAAASAPCCNTERMDLVNFRKVKLNKQELNNNKMREGNHVQDTAAQRALIGVMDPLVQGQQDVLTYKVDLCVALDQMSRGSNSSALNAKVGCLRMRISAMENAVLEMKETERRYANDVGLVFSKNSRIYMNALRVDCHEN